MSEAINLIKQEVPERLKPATEPKPSMYSDQSMDLNDSFTYEPQPGTSSSDQELMMPPRRPTAVSMISNKRKVSVRITQKFSPQMLNHLHQRGVMNRLENEAIELPYNENMARIRPQTARNDNERAQRDRSNVASRQSRLKAKMLEDELQKEGQNVADENRRQKIKISMYRVYISNLLKLSKGEPINFDFEFEKEQAKASAIAFAKMNGNRPAEDDSDWDWQDKDDNV